MTSDGSRRGQEKVPSLNLPPSNSNVTAAVVSKQPGVAEKFLTAYFVLLWMVFGLYSEIIGPTLPFLKTNINSDLASVTQALSGKPIGLLLGATIGGLAVDRLRSISNLVIGIGLTVSAAAMASFPYANHMGLYWAAFLAWGMAEGVLNILVQDTLLRIWKDKVTGPIHLLHLGFGCGACIMPLAVSLFFSTKSTPAGTSPVVSGKCGGSSNMALNQSLLNHSLVDSLPMDSESALIENAEPLVQYAFVLLGALGAAYSIVFYVVYFSRRSKDPNRKSVQTKQNFRESFRFSNCLPQCNAKEFLLLSILVMFFGSLAACDRLFGIFIFTYTQDELCFTASEGIQLNSAFWGVFTSARLVAFVFTRWLLPRHLLFIEVIGFSSCCTVLAVFSGSNVIVVWIFSLGAAWFMGPIIASGLAWANRYINVTGMAMTAILFGIATGAVACQTIMGYLFEMYGLGIMMYFAAGLSGLLLLLTGLLQPIAYSVGDRFDRKEAEDQPAKANSAIEMCHVNPQETDLLATAFT